MLNTDFRTFLIKFQFQGVNSQFIVQEDTFVTVLQVYDKNGIEFIKEYDPAKHKFKRIGKKDLYEYFMNIVHLDWKDKQYIKNHYYFKKR